jgi:Na+/H+-translocating membrane pyrophosphatase
MTPATYLAVMMFLPETFTINSGSLTTEKPNTPRLYAFYAVSMGVWGGLVIGYMTEYYTSYEYAPT